MPNSSYGTPIETPSGAVVIPSGRPSKPALDRLLERQGTWMLHVQTLNDFPCTVCGAIPGSGEGQGDCIACLGQGYKIRLSRQRVVLAKGRRTLAADSDILPGERGDSKYRMFIPVTSSIKTGDLLIEVVWDVKNITQSVGEPIELIHVYSIENAELIYFEGRPFYIMSILDNFDHHLDPIRKALEARRR